MQNLNPPGASFRVDVCHGCSGNGNGATLGEFGGIVPGGVFWHGPILFGRLIDDGGKVATTAVFHEHVEISSISIDVASYNVVMMVFLRVVTVSRWRNCTSWPRRTFLL